MKRNFIKSKKSGRMVTNVWKYALAVVLLSALGVNDGWASSSDYARGFATVSSATPSGKGKVYVAHTSEGGTQPDTPAASSSSWKTSEASATAEGSKTTFDFYYYSLPTSGYALEGWSETDGASDYSNNAVAKYSIKTSSCTLNDAYTDVRLYAHFVPNPTVTVTFLAPDPKCTYTVTCDGANVAVGSSKTTNKSFNLAVTVNDANYKLLGWYTTTDGGVTKSYFSPNYTYTNKYFSQTCSVGVDLVEADKPVFMVGDKLFTDLNAANTAAGGSGTIVLVSDGLLDVGNYTISSGNTLLIPHTIGSTFVNAKSVIDAPYIVKTAAPLSAFRKLTLQDGVNITVNGKICVAGKMMSSGGGKASAYPTGELGIIDMSRGGHIELNSGAILYAWGFIKGQDMDQGNNTTGAGTITANAGAVVWEGFATGDWRGGTNSSTLYDNADTWKFFPFQSYTIQNIEVPVTYNYNSKLSNYMSIFGDGQVYNGTFDLIGSSNTLFLLKDSSSKLKKWYDPTTDLVCYEMSGTTQLDALNVDAAGQTVSSKDYNLPISTSMHIIMASSTTISKPVEIQAGAVIEIKDGATVSCTSNVYMFDKDEWGEYCYTKYYYTMSNLSIHKDRGNGKSNAMIDDAKFIVDGTLNITGKLYTTTGGADIMGNGGGKVSFPSSLASSTNIVMCTGGADNENVAINQACLHNEDDSYTKAVASTTFHNVNGRWFKASSKDEKANHTYDFTYISSGAVSGTGGTNTTTDAVYSWDKTGLELRQKWFNVTADGCANWWHGQGEQAGWFYNWTLNSAWHQFMPTATTDLYSGSNNTLYTKTSCTWEELGSTDVNCLYEIVGVKKALVEGEFIALEPNNNDPAYHAADDASHYYICFAGCNWHEADKYTEVEKAYIIEPDTFIWYNNAWMRVNFEKPFAYTIDETNVPVYYEYVDGEWVLAEPYVRVVDGLEDRSYWILADAFKFASSALRTAPTITILRDISGITTAVSYTGANKTCTLNLNGHTISGSVTKMLNINAAECTFIITDNTELKQGKISMSGSANARLYAVAVTNGTLVLENGTIFGENTQEYVKDVTASTAISAVYVAAGKTFTMNNGMVHAKGCYAARGVDVAGSASANATVNINKGTVTAETTQVTYAYGIYAVGGTINVKNNATINATSKTTTAYGIYIDASTKKYYGTLNMTGGTVNVTNLTSGPAGGVFVQGVHIMSNVNNTTPNTIASSYLGVANISGGTFTVKNTSKTTGYGIYSLGNTAVSGSPVFNVTTTTTTAYGLFVQDGTTTINGTPTFNIKGTEKVYGIYANGLTPANKSGRPYNPQVTVNGGTFNVQTTSKTTAYGIFVDGNTRPMTSTASGYYQGNYASAGNVTVNGGTFNVTAKTSKSYGVVVAAPKTESGATEYDPVTANPKATINGGYFKMAGTSDVNAVNDLSTTDNLKVNGGYYSHDGNLATYTPSPKHVLTLAAGDANRPPYYYKVAEAYLVTFKNEDGTADIIDPVYQEKGTKPVCSTEPTKASTTTNSFTFDGWATSAGGAKVYEKNALPNVTGNVTYYAHFATTTLKYRVHLDVSTNDGVCDTENIYVEPGETIGTLPTATKYGYTFSGWFTAATGGTQLTSTTVINADAEYFAQFTVNTYTLTWVLDGGKVTTAGTAAAKNATGSPSGEVAYDAAITVPVVGKTGYVFANWTPAPATKMPAEAATYTAHWNPATNTVYTVKHYLQNVDGMYPADPTETQSLTGTTATSVTPAVKSYEGFVSPSAQTVTIAADGSTVVTYQYARRHYTFTLDAATNGGTSDLPSIEVIHGATIGTVPPDAQKGCNDFTGWYTKAVGGVKITSAFVIEYDMKTLYAQFSDDVRTYPITYNAGANGTGTVAGGTKTCGVNTTLSSSTFTRTGYTQTGWSLTDDGAQAYTLGAPYTDNDALALYPVWTINSYQIKFVDEDGTTNLGAYPQTLDYDSPVTAPEEPTKAADENYVYSFAGWSDGVNTYASSDIPNVSGAVTYTATYSASPTVASVSFNGGAATYYTTFADAIAKAKTADKALITILSDISGISTAVTYNPSSNYSCTLDLNGHTVAGSVTGLLTINKAGATMTIVDNSSANPTGQLRTVCSGNANRYCVYVQKGNLILNSGSIYAQNTTAYSSSNTSVGASAVYVGNASTYTFTMNNGNLEAKAKYRAHGFYSYGKTKIKGGTIIATVIPTADGGKSNAYGAYSAANTTTISGNPTFTINAPTAAYGAFAAGNTPDKKTGAATNGTVDVQGGTFNVTATDGAAYGVHANAGKRAISSTASGYTPGNYTSFGTVKVSGGEFNISGTTTVYGINVVKTSLSALTVGETTYPAVTKYGDATITGGKFNMTSSDGSAYAMNSAATATYLKIQGGYYSTKRTDASETSNIEDKYTAPAKDCNYHVLPLEGENPYKYEVAEAYTVTFNANGHGTAPEAQVVKDGQKATEPSPLSETGYTFGGWYKEEACTNQWDFATATVTAAQTLYAKWTAIEYTITFDTNGGSEVASIKQDFGSAVTAPANPTRTGYTFAGWLPDVPATMPVDGANCVAQWSIDTYNISYTLDGGTVASANPATYNVETATFTLNNPTKEGYTFLGWTGSNGETPQSTVSIAKGSTGDKSYTANWVVNVAAVTVGGETTYYASIAEAWEFVNDQTANTTIKLLQDATTTESLVFTPAAAMTCTLDLNNHTLSGAVSKLIDINLAGSTFVITDSSEDKNGKVLAEYSVNARLYAVFLTAGTLNLKAGHIHSKNPHTYSSATANKNSAATGLYVTKGQKFTMDGGTIESESQYSSIAIYASETGTTPITINNGLVKGHTTASTTAMGIYTYGKNLTVNGGTIIGHAWTTTAYGIYVRGGSATLNGGRIEATNDTTNSKGSTTTVGVYARGPITIPATSTVDVLAKSRTNTAYAVQVYSGISGNTIASGTFIAIAKTGKTAAAIVNAGGITISGGTFNATAKTSAAYGISASRTMTVSGSPTFNVTSGTSTAYGIYSTRGTVTINGNPTFVVTAGSTTAYGAFAYGTVGANGKSKYSGTIEINGGTFNVTSTKENAWGAYAGLYSRAVNLVIPENAADTIAGQHYMPGIISVTNGTFNVKAKTTAAYGIVVAAAKSESGAVGTTARRPTATITGGNFKVESEGDDNATAYAMNTSATATYLKVQGGKYSTKRTNASETSNIEDKYTAPTKACNYHVLDLPEEELPYKYKVAEAYNLTWDAAGGELSGLYTSGYTAVGDPITVPTATRTDYDFSGWNESPAATMPASDKTYTATWTFAETGDYVDIVDWTSNGDGTGTLTINANGWAASGWPNTINGTSYAKEDRAADRTLTIPYEGAAGTNLQIKVESGGSTTSLHSYKIPYINTTEGAGEEDVVYMNEGTLTISSNTTLAALYIRPEASVEVTSGTLTVGKLVMRTLPWQAAAISGNFTASETWYTRIAPNMRTITGPYAPITYESARYYQFALPRACTAKLKDIQVSNAANTPYGNTWLLKRYNEETRAEKGIGEANWVALGNEEYIQGGVGYEMFSNSNYYREFYFPLGAVSSASLGNTTAVSSDMGAAGEKHAGWNWVSSPLMSVYDNSDADPEEGMKIGILMTDGSYDQGVPEYIYPAIPFSYQASEGQSVISFEGSSIVAAAPQRRAAADESVRKQWIHVNIQDEDGIGDHTSILAHPTRYEQTYKTGIDVAKQSFTASRPLIYSSHTYGEMAFAAVADSLLEIGIPLTVYSPKPQELTISMRDNNWLDRLAEVWLVDMETGAQTDLFDSDYTFEATEGTTRGRIFLMGRFKAPNIATDIETTEANEDQNMKAQKLIIRDKLYIRLNGQLYDATGKLVNDK